jgi:hypothetical protein
MTSFDFNQIDILMLNEAANNNISADVTNRVPDIRTWVEAGGRLVVHDRSAGNSPNPSPLLVGAPSSVLTRALGSDVDVISPATSLVTAGPFGWIDNTALDGGSSSYHGYADTAGLPGGTRRILSVGGNSARTVSLSYPLGQGQVYYSTIPLDYYLDYPYYSTFGSNAVNIYTPNVLAYVNALGTTPVIGYYTDNNNSVSNAEPLIIRAGYTPLKITNITTFDFSQVSLLMLNESSGLSTALSNRLGDVKDWVLNGGKVVVHDRSPGTPVNGGPRALLVGAPASRVYYQTSADVDVIAPGNTLVTAGPFGIINNTNLDGGN